MKDNRIIVFISLLANAVFGAGARYCFDQTAIPELREINVIGFCGCILGIVLFTSLAVWGMLEEESSDPYPEHIMD